MSFTHASGTRDNIATQVQTDIEVGASASQLVLRTTGAVAVATLPMSDPTVGSVSGGVLTFTTPIQDTNAAGGTTDRYTIENGNASAVLTGDAGSVTGTGGGGDIELSSTTIGATDTVTINTLTYTAAV